MTESLSIRRLFFLSLHNIHENLKFFPNLKHQATSDTSGMKTYKREDKLYSSIAHFLIFGFLFKYLIVLSLILTSIVGFLNYQNHAYDHIRVVAQSSNPDSFFSYFDRDNVSFDLKLETENQKLNFENIQTPFSMKIPKGERIKVQLSSDSKFICCSLRNAGSSVAASNEKEMKLERIENQFKINCN